ncbi:hypothetical protein ASE63_17730 [Bosea sp. Root381]|uniref:hypothetical protein n=1 Tax=Bosea sp. Root381 TaxID=1736524 RepID=UPI0006F30082|nr:hypothetical protein [Bosea sp. Root381]KRE13855.1 hypothetical protein ASE63_17730 [Bosea sp. Root381]
MSRHVNVTTRVGREGPFRVDLPLDPGTLNERLFDIGLWLVEREIPHQARIFMEPEHERLRVSFPDAENADAFRKRFGSPLN